MGYTIAEASKRTGISIHTLRYYDKEGILPFVSRTPSGIRDFKESDFEWLTVISCLKKTGMPIKNIKKYIEMCIEGDPTIADRLEVFNGQKALLGAKMAELQACMDMINYKIWYYETAAKAGTTSIHKKQEPEDKETVNAS